MMRFPLTKKDKKRARHLKRKAEKKLDNLGDIRKIPKLFQNPGQIGKDQRIIS
jgi:hypothetical protein